MYPRKYNKQNKIKRFILKLLNVYAYNKETLNIANPNFKNDSKNIVKFNNKSFNFTQGYLNLSRKIKKLDIFYRFAPGVNLWNSTERWKRIVPNINKEDLINVCILSLKNSILSFLENNKLSITLHLIFDNSTSRFNDQLVKLVTDNKIKVILHESKIKGNRGSYLECCDQAEKAEDLIFFIEDDYLFEENCIEEMLLTYSRISTIINKDICMCPSDYPFFYDSLYDTNLFIGKDYRWRSVGETLLTFLFSKHIYDKYRNLIRLVGEQENIPFEKPLHEVYKNILCLAPISSLSYHVSRNVPSIIEDWTSTWNKNYNELKKLSSNNS